MKGYDHRSGRKKSSGPVSPSTLEGDLAYLRKNIFPELEALGAAPNPEQLIDLYSKKLLGENQDSVRRRLQCIRRFHSWMVRDAGFPPLKFTFKPHNPGNSVRARLISEREYLQALDKAAGSASRVSSALRVSLILGFRAGLRPGEFVALQPGDFRISSEGLVLIVKPNRHARLKTSNARRLLPLHLLLTPNERSEVEALVRSRQRLRGKTIQGPMLLHEATSPEDIAAREAEIRRAIEQILAEVTGDPKARYYDLRHSFASYLSATLLLPEGVDARVAPSIGPDCVSQERRERLWQPLLGDRCAGRPALYAVSFLMGHASPEWTLTYYNHLLDWSAAQHVEHIARSKLGIGVRLSSDFRDENGFDQDLEFEKNGRSTLVRARTVDREEVWPEWQFAVQALSDLMDGAGLFETAAASGIDKSLLGEWYARLSAIIDMKTRTGRKRHRFVASSREAERDAKVPKPDLLPRNDRGLDMVERVWGACQRGTNNVPAVIQALGQFLHGFDPIRCDVPFGSAPEAMSYVSAMTKLGIHPASFRVRLQKARTAHRSDLLKLPQPHKGLDGWTRLIASSSVSGEPVSAVSRFRISIVNDETDRGRALPSHRVALLLAAATGKFPLDQGAVDRMFENGR